MVKEIIISSIALLISSCGKTTDLDMQYLGGSPGAFIECYCQPGELYNLTATYLAAIDDPQSLDYSYRFEAYITDTEQHRLLQGIFIKDNVIYSHGSPERLPQAFSGELSLSIKAENGECYTATTEVPSDVDPFTAYREKDNVIIEFDSSEQADQNYYAAAAVAKLPNGKLVKSVSKLLNPECSTTQRATLHFKKSIESAVNIEVNLLRLTHEGYIYQGSVLENIQSTTSNIIVGSKLKGNIAGCNGIFTCYTKATEVIY